MIVSDFYFSMLLGPCLCLLRKILDPSEHDPKTQENRERELLRHLSLVLPLFREIASVERRKHHIRLIAASLVRLSRLLASSVLASVDGL